MNIFNNDIDVTKFYKRTFWMLRIYSSILSIGCFIISIVALFLDVNKFPMKYSMFGYLFVSSIAIEVFYLIITSIFMRFVFKDEINYRNNMKNASKSIKDLQETTNTIQNENDFEDNSNNVSKKQKTSMSSREISSTIVIISIFLLVMIALIGLVVTRYRIWKIERKVPLFFCKKFINLKFSYQNYRNTTIYQI